MDYLDVVVHIFTPQTREFYRLERLWGRHRRERRPREPDAAGVNTLTGFTLCRHICYHSRVLTSVWTPVRVGRTAPRGAVRKEQEE